MEATEAKSVTPFLASSGEYPARRTVKYIARVSPHFGNFAFLPAKDTMTEMPDVIL